MTATPTPVNSRATSKLPILALTLLARMAPMIEPIAPKLKMVA